MNRQSKIWTRLSALCLALLLAVGMLGTTAFAANDIVANTGSITVENVEGGVTVSATEEKSTRGCRLPAASFTLAPQALAMTAIR